VKCIEADTMAHSYVIEAPVILLQLPRSVDTTPVPVQAGPSHTISGSKKRKRTEIVHGSSGDSINVYDVGAVRMLKCLMLMLL